MSFTGLPERSVTNARLDAVLSLVQPDMIEAFPASIATGSFSPVANQVYLSKVSVLGDVLISSLIIHVRTASGNVCIGLYENVAGTLNRIATTGSVAAVGATAAQSIPLLAPVWLKYGRDYRLAFEADNATVAVDRSVVIATVAGMGSRAMSIAAGAFPLPATITAASTAGSSTIIAMVGV